MQKGIVGSLVALALALGISAPRRPVAADLAPSKASQVVMLNAFGTCPSSTIPLSGSVALAARIAATGVRNSTSSSRPSVARADEFLVAYRRRRAERRGTRGARHQQWHRYSRRARIRDTSGCGRPSVPARNADARDHSEAGFVPCLIRMGITSVLSADALGFLVKDK